MKRWQYLGWLAWIALIALCIAALYTDIRHTLKDNNPKLIEIKGSKLRGFNQRKLNWEVICSYMWAGKSDSIFTAQTIHAGRVFDSQGRKVLEALQADAIEVNAQFQSFVAKRNLAAKFIQRIPSGNPSPIIITAEEFEYFGDTQRGYFRKETLLRKGKSQIIPRKGLDINTELNIASIQNGFTMISPQFITSGNTMTIDIDQDISQLQSLSILRKAEIISKNVRLDTREKLFRSQPSHITCETLKFTQKEGLHMIYAAGKLHLWQADKHLTGEQGFYDEKNHLYVIEKKVNFTAKTLGWILDPARRKPFKNKDMLKALALSIEVRCDKASFNSSTKTLVLEGHVSITQPDKEIKCDKLVYNDLEELITLDGHVSIDKDNEDRFDCEGLTLDLKKEAFWAKSSIKSEFILKD